MTNALDIQHLYFSYGHDTILEDINLSLSEHKFLGLIGPNGAGKTTLIKIITGLLSPTQGSIRVFGKSPYEIGERIGYVPQSFTYDETFPITVFEVVLMGRLSRHKLWKPYNKEDHRAACQAMETMEIYQHKKLPMETLSGGQRQRVLLARALASSPDLLILDEPLSGVDISLGKPFYEILKVLQKTITIILISHDVGVVSGYVDTIACLNKQLFCHGDKETALHNLEKVYGCPIDVIAHGVPHRVLKEHGNDKHF